MNAMHNFKTQKQYAINQINEMQKRATSPAPQVEKPPKGAPVLVKNTSADNQKLSFLLSNDAVIIFGLILILSSEKSDMLLLLALIYILT